MVQETTSNKRSGDPKHARPSTRVNALVGWHWKVVMMIAIALHALGVLAEPLRFFSGSDGGDAPEFSWLATLYRPYSQFLYLDHGYFFFAPNPGPGHLLECDIEKTESGEASSTYLLPDRSQHWPRLLYHRYFMLSEFYHSRFAPSQVTEELKKDPAFMSRWNVDSHFYRQLQASIKKSLSESQKGTVVSIKRIERRVPTPDQVLLDKLPLNDPTFLIVLPESMREPLPDPRSPATTSSVESVPGIKATGIEK